MLQEDRFIHVRSKEENEIVRAYYVEHCGLVDEPWCDDDYLVYPYITKTCIDGKQYIDGFRAETPAIENCEVVEFSDWAAAHGVLRLEEFACSSINELANLLGVM